MSKELSARIKNKIDTSANWATNNPVLLNGEFGIESDTKKMKVGDGSSHWNDLTYISGEGGAAILYTTEEELKDETNLKADTYYATDDEEDINLSTAEAIQQEIAQKTKRYLTESWSLEDGTLWYNIYNDGWKECGGIYTNTSGSLGKTAGNSIDIDFKFPISFSNTNYVVDITNYWGGTQNHSVIWDTGGLSDRTLDAFILVAIRAYTISSTPSSTIGCNWRACGY